MTEKTSSNSTAGYSPARITELSSKRVLVVEDDRSHRSFIDKVLLSCGLITVMAENGKVALSKIDEGEHFDLILMDLDMPELGGIETTKAIRMREKKEGSPHKPVIAFTACRMPEDRQKALAAGMDAYLPKDILLPKWRATLIDNLQGLICGDFDLEIFAPIPSKNTKQKPVDLKEFDEEIFEQTKALLKEELEIAIEEYLEDAVAYIRDIEAGIKKQIFTDIARGSHPLKSNSKGFGLLAVSTLAEKINMLAEQGAQTNQTMHHIKLLFQQLKKAFDYGEKRLQQELKN